MNKLFILLILFFSLMTSIKAIDFTEEEKEYLAKKPYLTTMSLARFHPFAFTKEGQHLGYSNDLLRLFSTILNKELRYVTKPWKEQLEMLKEGSLDFIPYLAMNDERAEYMDFTDFEYFSYLNGLTVSKNSKINSIEDLKGKKIAVVNKYWYHDHLKKNFPDIKLLLTNSTEESVEAVAHNKADAAIDNITSMNYYIQDSWLRNLEITSIADLNLPIKSRLYMSVKKGNKLLKSILEKTYNSIPEETIINLKKQWFIGIYVPKKTIKFTPEEQEYLLKKKTLTVSNLESLPPFNFYENGQPLGYTIDYMSLMSKYMQLDIEFISNKPFKEYLGMLKNGTLDLIPHLAVNAERKKFFDYTDFNHIEYTTGFVIKKDDNVKSIVDLKDKIIAVTNKSFLHTKLKNQFPEQAFYLTSSTKEALDAVSSNKADVAIGSLPALNYFIQKNWISNVKTVKIKDIEIPTSTQLPMGVKKGNNLLKSILEKVNKAIPLNEISKLKQTWMNVDFKKDKKANDLSNDELAYLKKKEKILMCVLPNWLPFEQIDENGKHKGIGADIMKIVSKYIKKPIILVPTKEWSQSLQNIRDRKCDILPVAMNIPSRRDAMNFTKPYTAEPFVIATKADEFFIKDSMEIKDRKIGIVKSYAFIEVLKQKNPDIQIVNVKNAKDGLERVQSGELYGYIDIMAAVGYTIQEYGMLDLKIAGKLEFDIELSVASRNDEPLLNSIMQKALNDISQEQIRTIVGRWISIKVQQAFDYTKLFYVIAFFSSILFLFIYKNRVMSNLNRKLALANKEIKEEQQKSEELALYQQSLLSLFDKGDAVLCKWENNTSYNVDYVSSSILTLTGYLKEDFISGKISYFDCIHPDDINIVHEKIKESMSSKMDYYKHEPYRLITKEGEEKWIIDYKVTQKDLNGNITHCLGYLADITEHLRHQETLAEKLKMASLGEMIGNISHQWRQPLSIISTAATGTMLHKEIDILTDERLSENMHAINENAQYLSKTIDDFKNFIKGDRKPTTFNLTENIHSFINVIQTSISTYQIQLIENYQEDITIKGYPNDMIQALINIFNNAKDALLELPEEERYFFITTVKHEDNIMITLKDNAGGIDESIINKVFEPYITTKHKSQGTGLGLNITYNFIVIGMNGKITVENTQFTYNNKEYTGAEFKIYFSV